LFLQLIKGLPIFAAMNALLHSVPKKNRPSGYHALLVLLVLFGCFNAHAQNQANNWYFGNHAGITFNCGKPQYTLPESLPCLQMKAVQ